MIPFFPECCHRNPMLVSNLFHLMIHKFPHNQSVHRLGRIVSMTIWPCAKHRNSLSFRSAVTKVSSPAEDTAGLWMEDRLFTREVSSSGVFLFDPLTDRVLV